MRIYGLVILLVFMIPPMVSALEHFIKAVFVTVPKELYEAAKLMDVLLWVSLWIFSLPNLLLHFRSSALWVYGMTILPH